MFLSSCTREAYEKTTIISIISIVRRHTQQEREMFNSKKAALPVVPLVLLFFLLFFHLGFREFVNVLVSISTAIHSCTAKSIVEHKIRLD